MHSTHSQLASVVRGRCLCTNTCVLSSAANLLHTLARPASSPDNAPAGYISLRTPGGSTHARTRGSEMASADEVVGTFTILVWPTLTSLRTVLNNTADDIFSIEHSWLNCQCSIALTRLFRLLVVSSYCGHWVYCLLQKTVCFIVTDIAILLLQTSLRCYYRPQYLFIRFISSTACYCCRHNAIATHQWSSET